MMIELEKKTKRVENESIKRLDAYQNQMNEGGLGLDRKMSVV